MILLHELEADLIEFVALHFCKIPGGVGGAVVVLAPELGILRGIFRSVPRSIFRSIPRSVSIFRSVLPGISVLFFPFLRCENRQRDQTGRQKGHSGKPAESQNGGEDSGQQEAHK